MPKAASNDQPGDEHFFNDLWECIDADAPNVAAELCSDSPIIVTACRNSRKSQGNSQQVVLFSCG